MPVAMPFCTHAPHRRPERSTTSGGLSALAAALVAGLAAPSFAAPGDLASSARPSQQTWQLEGAYDLVNDRIDVLGLRSKPAAAKTANATNATTTTAAAPTTSSGDYAGQHLVLRWQPAADWRLEASAWKRGIDYKSFAADIRSWSASAQWRFADAQGWRPDVAVRLGAWGNAADELRRETNVRVQGYKFTSARVTDPRDQQVQLDAIATWPLRAGWEGTLWGGVVHSRTDFGSVSAVLSQGGCSYDVSFGAERVDAVCNRANSVLRLSMPNDVIGIDVNREGRYRSTMAQAGLGLRWQGQRTSFAVGLKQLNVRRGHVDEKIESRGGTAYRNNTVVSLEMGWRATRTVETMLRAQLMSNQFNGEIPMTYNTLTADRFDKRYGLLMAGLTLRF